MRRPSPFATIFLIATLATGCGTDNRKRIVAPSFSPSTAASEAMALYDTNKDGFLDAAELEKCPALKANLKKYDTNGDGKISADEIAARLQKFRDSNIGMISSGATLTLNNRPLANATVTLIPEPFLGSSFKRATGVTDKGGGVVFKTDGQNVEGVACGLYRVEVSLMTESGKEELPAKYNTQSTLGCEIAPDVREGLAWKLVGSVIGGR